MATLPTEISDELPSLRSLVVTVAELGYYDNAVVSVRTGGLFVPVVHVGDRADDTPAADALCQLAADSATLVWGEDAATDSRLPSLSGVTLSNGSLVSGGQSNGAQATAIRRFAAVPLIDNDARTIGALCIWAGEAGPWGDTKLAAFQALADHVTRILELATARRRLQTEALAASAAERRQRRWLEAAPMAFWQVDEDLRITAWSPAAARLLGHAPSQAIGTSVVDLLVPAEHREAIGSQLTDIVSHGRLASSEQRMTLLRADGVERIFDLTLWTDNYPAVLNTFGRDVTEQVTGVRNLEEAETRWRLAFESAPFGLTVQRLTPSGLRYEQVNQAMCDLVGYSALELMELGSAGITHPDDAAKDRDAVHQLASGARRSFERSKRYIHSDGRTVDALINSVYTRDHDGEILVSQVQDVTALEDALSAQQEKAALLDLTQEAIFVRNLDGIVTFWNRGAEILYGIPAARAIGRQTHALLETEFPDDFEVIRKQLVEEGHWEGLLKHTDVWGNRKTVMSRWAYRSEPGREDTILEINSDVTAEIAAQARQQRAEALFELAFIHAPIGVGILGTSGTGQIRWLQTNAALNRLFTSATEVLDQPIAGMLEPEAAPEVLRTLSELLRGRREQWTGEWTIPATGGRRYLTAQCIAVPQVGDDDRIILVQLQDVTRQRGHERWLREQALTDPLTGLNNRLAINEVLEQELSRLGDGLSLAVVFCDLNHFKQVNDTYGHESGDVVLTRFGELLKSAAPLHCTVGRLSGDEFVVVAPGHTEATAHHLARRIRETAVVSVGDGDNHLEVTTSIGYAVTSDPAMATQALLSEADAEMYANKRSNRTA